MKTHRMPPHTRAGQQRYPQSTQHPQRPVNTRQYVRSSHHYATPRRRSLMVTGALVVIFAVMVGGVGWLSVQALGGNPPFADADARSQDGQVANSQVSGGSISTPKSEWTKGSVPYLYQEDPAWANERYAENNFGESGCGPTCLSMVYIALTGKSDKDPAAMGVLSTAGGHASADGTSWSFMTDGAASLGLRAEELPANEDSIRRRIVAGNPVICSMGPGDFTEIGHFIVLTDIDQNGNLVVRDPNSPDHSAKTWSFETVLGQSRNIWSYSLV